MKFIYVDYEQIIGLHTHVLTISTGLEGIAKAGLIDSALEHLKNDDYYPEFHNKLTHLVWSISHNHVFNDGNKRTAISAGALFILYNFDYKLAELFIPAMEEIIVQVAEGVVTKEHLSKYIHSFLQQNDSIESNLLNIWRDIYNNSNT